VEFGEAGRCTTLLAFFQVSKHTVFNANLLNKMYLRFLTYNKKNRLKRNFIKIEKNK